LGAAGEDLAAQWYKSNGYRVIDRNWRCREGEIDLIVQGHGVVAFCEVKTRSSQRFGSPFDAVDHHKQQRIRRVATLWLRESSVRSRRLRFDVVGVVAGEVEVRTNAF
jgi:putative endonuclease